MRYIHIPIGYDGIPDAAGRSLARVVRDVEGPIYVHCHHGKHRGPAAAAVLCLAAGKMQAEQANAFLQQAGTSEDYAGLWRDVAAYSPPADAAELPELVEVAEVEALAVTMAATGHTWDRLKLIAAAGWKTPANHPDLVPAQESLLLKEAFHEAARNLAADADDGLRHALQQAEKQAAELENALRRSDAQTAGARFTAIEASCRSCHAARRN